MNARARISIFPSRLSAIFVFLLTLTLAACAAPPSPPPPTATTAPSATPTPTATIVWFPATNTPTAAPTLAPIPTIDLAAEAGPLLFADDFDNETLWTLASGETGSAAIANNHLTLVTLRDRISQFSLRSQPLLADFYLEVTASPNLCRGADEFGIILRATPSFDHYRFGLSCDGRAHVDRFYGGAVSAIQPWAAFPFLPTAPAPVRLAVWADGSQIRLYANGQFLFSLTDSLFYRGMLGLYVRSTSTAGMSVNFTDLAVYAIP